MSSPKVFISYSHDSEAHKQWVLKLGEDLITAGIEVTLDQWDLQPGDSTTHFMETHLKLADYTIIVCTENYVKKANAGEGGVGYEKMIITATLLNGIDQNKIIPIIRTSGKVSMPTFLSTRLYINFSQELNYDEKFDKLIRTIHQSPLRKKPPLGKNPFDSTVEHFHQPESQKNKAVDSVAIFMKALAELYEKGTTPWIPKNDVKHEAGYTSIELESLIQKAVASGYIAITRARDIEITDAGKQYIIDQRIA